MKNGDAYPVLVVKLLSNFWVREEVNTITLSDPRPHT